MKWELECDKLQTTNKYLFSGRYSHKELLTGEFIKVSDVHAALGKKHQ